MKREKFNFGVSKWITRAVLAMILIVGVAAQTQTNTAQNSNTAPPAQEDFWTAGQNVEINKEGVRGDAALVGANVKISGDVKGYLMAAGANVNVDAPIGNDLWAAGANVIVTAPVADNATMAGSTVVLEPGATIGGDARIAAGNAEIKSRVARNLNISAANAQISSEIGGKTEAYVENLTLNSGAVVRGDLVVHSPNEPVISPQAQVLGRVDYQRVERNDRSSGGKLVASWLMSFLWLTVLGLAAVRASAVWTNRVSEMIKNQPGNSFLAGFIATILVPIVALILLITFLGIPLAVVLGAFYVIGFILSGVFVSYLVGSWILPRIKRWENSGVAKIIVGALIVSFVYTIPLIGFLAQTAVLFFGFGALMLERRDFFRQMRAQGLA